MKMKVSELKKIIKEEITQTMQEMDYDPTGEVNPEKQQKQAQVKQRAGQALQEMFPGLDVEQVDDDEGMVQYYLRDFNEYLAEKMREKGLEVQSVVLDESGGEHGLMLKFSPLMQEEEKPSAGMSKKEKSEVVKKAKKGEDIGKPGKGFKAVEKAAKKSGARDPEAVAAAAMWKQQAKKAGK